MIRIAPSILSADFARLGDAVRMAEAAGADLIHIDIMDGHFVPTLTFGPRLVASLRRLTRLPLDVHLMVDNPRHFIPLFAEAGADWISIHVEASSHLHKDVTMIRDLGRRPGVALNPATPLPTIDEILPELDFVLLMTVNPGWGGQAFIPSSRAKIRNLRETIRARRLAVEIEVDGGVKLDNLQDLLDDGMEVVVAGSAVFEAADPPGALRSLKDVAARAAKNRP